MAKLNENRIERVPTCLNLPKTTRNELESSIGQLDGITTLTEAVIEAAKLLAAKVKKKQKPPS